MSAPIRIEQFGGMIPRLDDATLPQNCAVDAINCDLMGNGIKPMYATLFKRNVNAALYYTSTVFQLPTSGYVVSKAGGGTSYVAFTPPVALPVVGANDKLFYAVFIPSSPAPVAGQGCINIEFSDGRTLALGIVDQNGKAAVSGDLTAYAGSWLVRIIPLGGQNDSLGGAITGKTIAKIRFFQNHGSATIRQATYAYAFVRDPVASIQRGVLFDVDNQQAPNLITAVYEARYAEIDEDDFVIIGSGFEAGTLVGTDGIVTMARASMSGYPRSKTFFAKGGAFYASVTKRVFARSNHDNLWSYYNTPGEAVQDTWDVQQAVPPASFATANSRGWAAVAAPAIALPVPAVAGGAGPVVTRAYVSTNVSEDGFESAPSPPVSQTGNSTGGASWNFAAIPLYEGTDKFVGEIGGAPLTARRRIYRTPAGSSNYFYVGELDYNDTAFNDAVLDANLGDELATADYLEPPALSSVAAWSKGLIGGLLEGTQVCFCVPYQYHAWPLAQRYTLPSFGMGVGSYADRFMVVTKGKPVVLSGVDPADLLPDEIEEGEACIGAKGVIDSDIGVIYPGVTGWGLITPAYTNLTAPYLKSADYTAIVNKDTVACYDNRRLIWINQGGTTGYMLERGAQERGLVKFEVPDPVQALNYYGPRDARWMAYTNGGLLKIGKLFGDASQRLKATWKSKLLHLAKPARLKVAQVKSNEWDSLTNNMAYREGFYRTIQPWVTGFGYIVGDFVTQGGNTYRCDIAHASGVFATDLAAVKWILTNAVYSINIAGLTQAEAWCYLKVWADADKATKKTLVFDDFVVSDRPVRLARVTKSDCYQFEWRGNIAISSIALAATEKDLNQE